MRKRWEGTASWAHSALLVRVVFINSFATIAVLAVLAMVWRVPLVFPSLGPTAFLLFAAPELPSAWPRNALRGHAIGILCGYGALWLTGLQHAPSAMLEGVTLARVAAAALSIRIMLAANKGHFWEFSLRLKIVPISQRPRPSSLYESCSSKETCQAEKKYAAKQVQHQLNRS